MIDSAQVEMSPVRASKAKPEHKAEGATRLISLDAFRGMVMLLTLRRQLRIRPCGQFSCMIPRLSRPNRPGVPPDSSR
jgi:hypothetical protein